MAELNQYPVTPENQEEGVRVTGLFVQWLTKYHNAELRIVESLSISDEVTAVAENVIPEIARGLFRAEWDEWPAKDKYLVERGVAMMLGIFLRECFPKNPQGEVEKLRAEIDEALKLLNQHLKGRTYTDLNDAVRNLTQAYISLRDHQEDANVG
jgi:hypothetical protein